MISQESVAHKKMMSITQGYENNATLDTATDNVTLVKVIKIFQCVHFTIHAICGDRT